MLIEVILIWVFCIIIIVVMPIMGLIAFVYIVTNAPIGGWKIESKLHRFECDICPTPRNCRQCKRYNDSIKSSLIRRG